jgi:hypothetical protein
METVINKINSKKSLNKIKVYSIETIIEHEDKIVYHNVSYAQRIAKNIRTIIEEDRARYSDVDMDVLEMSAWLYTALLGGEKPDTQNPEDAVQVFAGHITEQYPTLLNEFEVSNEDAETIISTIISGLIIGESQNKYEGIFRDAVMMDYKGKNARERLIQFYEETILADADLSISKFYDMIIGYLANYIPYTEYGKNHIQPPIQRLIYKLEIEKKKISKKKSTIIKKQLDIDDSELKEIKKSMKSLKGRDARGIQTLFRTTSKNHYTLNEMVDRKANIMITVNAIILSLLMSGLLDRRMEGSIPLVVPMTILSVASLFSIVFAILSITPSRTQGNFSRDDVKNKRSNLLYYGNFRKMKFEDYERGMLEKLNDSDFLYGSMIKDLYYLGKSLSVKYNFIRLSLTIFLVGLIASFLVSTIYRITYAAIS